VDKLFELVKQIGPGRLLSAGVVLATVVAFLAVVAVRLTSPNMALLYGDLEIDDSGDIVAHLESMAVPYEIKGNGSMVYVPDSQVLRLRMAMAEQGLPSGGSVGWELFDRSDSLGTTSFVQNINHLRALEGELARTIRTLDRIAAARVHLVLPRRELFSRESRQPSASIILKLKGGELTDGQVDAIQSLVAAAVPDMKTKQVSIVDDRGRLLSTPGRATGTAGSEDFARLRASHEARLKGAIESLVERSVGAGSVRAEVSMDMNFDRVTTNSELYDPESQVARSTRTVEESDEGSDNATGQAVSVGNNLPEAQDTAQGTNGSFNRSGRTEETVNFEISKTVKTQVHQSGKVNKLSVAVLVDGIVETDADGNRQYKPRSGEELAQIETLVKTTIGYDESRGDQVKVINMRFERLEDDPNFVGEDGLMLTKHDYMRIGEIAALTLIGLLTVLLVLRPLSSRMFSHSASPVGTPVDSGSLIAAAQAALPPGQTVPQLTATPAAQAEGDAAAAPAIAAPLSGPQIAASEIIKSVEAGHMQPETAKALITQVGDVDLVDLDEIENQVRQSATRKMVELVERHPDEAVSIMRSWMYEEA
jgi:flagellar M-ring protein FliF